MATDTITSRRSGGAKAVLIWLLIVLVVGAGAYSYGRWQGLTATRAAQQQVETAQGQVEAARTAGQSALSGVQGEVASRDARIRQLEARRQLHLSLMALDQRNFGTAQQYLTAAAILLGNAPRIGDTEITSLVEQIRDVKFTPGQDIARQREQVVGFVQQLDRALPSWDSGASAEGHSMAMPGTPGAPGAAELPGSGGGTPGVPSEGTPGAMGAPGMSSAPSAPSAPSTSSSPSGTQGTLAAPATGGP